MPAKWTRAILVCLCSFAVISAGCSASRTQAQFVPVDHAALGPYPQSVTVTLRGCDLSLQRVRVIDDPDSTVPLLWRHGILAVPSDAVSPQSGQHFVDVIVKVGFSDRRSLEGMTSGWSQLIVVGGQTLEPVDVGAVSQGSTSTFHARFSVPQTARDMVLRVTPPSDVSSMPVDFDLW